MTCWQPPHSPQMTEAAALSRHLLFARSHLPSPITRPLQFSTPTVACVIGELLSMWAVSPGWAWVTKKACGWAGGRALGGDGIFRNHCCTVLCSDGVGFLFPGIRLDWSLKENYPEDVLVPKKAMIKWVVAFSAILLPPLTLGLLCLPGSSVGWDFRVNTLNSWWSLDGPMIMMGEREQRPW